METSMSEETKPVATPAGPDKDEAKKRRDAAIQAGLASIVESERQKYAEETLGVIREFSAVDRTSVPDVYEVKDSRVGRLASPTEPLYRRMPEEERAIRNPDSDHYMREWIVGLVNKDRAQQLEASANLERIFGRADTLIGAAGASGAFGNGTGATLLPRPLEALIEIGRDRVTKMARFARTIQMTAQQHNVPTGAAMTAYMMAEGTSPVTTGATFSQVALVAHRAVAKAIASREMLDDAAVNVISFFASRAGAALGALEDLEFFKDGTGTAPHVTKLAGTSYVETTPGTLGYGDVVAMYSALQQEYRSGAVWFASSSVLQRLANVRDGNGRPFYASLLERPAVIGDDGPQAVGALLGKPVYETVLSAGDLWFGDPNLAYCIGRRQGIEVNVNDSIYADEFKVLFLISQRIAGNNLDASAAQYCTGITTVTSV